MVDMAKSPLFLLLRLFFELLQPFKQRDSTS